MRRVGLAVLIGLLAAPMAKAQTTFPTKAITMVVAFAPGGGTDTAARLIAKDLAAELGQPIVIDNRAGAGGAIGALSVVRAAPDGHTLLFGTGSELDVLTAVKAKAPYDPLHDFEPISRIGSVSFLLAATPSLKADSVGELIALARTDPGKITFASFGIGSTNHLIGEAFSSRNGVQFVHVPYKGSAAAVADLLSGQVEIAFDTASVMIPYVRSGKLKALASLSNRRLTLAPDLPTMMESGVPDFVFEGWLGVLAPRGTPAAVIDRLHTALAKILKSPPLTAALTERGIGVVASSPAEFSAFMKADVERWKEITRTADIKVD
ncbi:tripartite tricarboxylate transporter substrate binding protein [Bradyrhizobium liaoningense]|uniref:Bug family tripartite tricarboxylate transporter substrate binding protein n=1 Tax=Bradyrhizobium liaoningense TaxID=43992 RepID=UPI001BAB68E6|nr:tripartite tricarboxylate transporter substrate binding protein [Bradyrhizobium liaoningense]MBR0843256.1 tripartite tricarboxylate transporter substrate binding protein [Bradyrhizobium liaoningense]